MSGDAETAARALTRHFLLDHPRDAANRLESMEPSEAADILTDQPTHVLTHVWHWLAPHAAVELLKSFDERWALKVLRELAPNEGARLIGLLEPEERQVWLDKLEDKLRSEIEEIMSFPAQSAGRMMDTRFSAYRADTTVGQVLDSMRKAKSPATRSVYVLDDENKLTGRATIQALALSADDLPLEELSQPVAAAVTPVSPQQEVAEVFERRQLADLPVIDINGVLIGVIYNAELVRAVEADATAGMQTMVGASRDERALSKPFFAVRKRLPWLEINLLTAFLAASVVGLFEDTIARFTALAVLLPVVAGQSGNAGAQALAVTMRGLALREITVRQWFSVTTKEVKVGFVNGIAVAVTCAAGVYFWSGSLGLVIVIAISMVIAMVAAGFAGAVVPIVLTRLGQDPAQSSSIVLTTVTDVAGFLSFLGIATLLSGMLEAG